MGKNDFGIKIKITVLQIISNLQGLRAFRSPFVNLALVADAVCQCVLDPERSVVTMRSSGTVQTQ